MKAGLAYSDSGIIYGKIKDLDKSLSTFKTYVSPLASLSEPKFRWLTLNSIANVYAEKYIVKKQANDILNALDHYNRSLNYQRTLGMSPSPETVSNFTLALTLHGNNLDPGSLNQAEKIIREIYHQELPKGVPKIMIPLEIALATVLTAKGNSGNENALKEAILRYQYLLKRLDSKVDPEKWALVSSNIGHVFIKASEQFDPSLAVEAIPYLEDSLTVYSESRYPMDRGRVLHNIGIAYRIMGLFEDKIHFENSIKYLREAVEISPKYGDTYQELARRSDLATALQKYSALTGRLEIADQAAQEFRDLQENINPHSNPKAWFKVTAGLASAIAAQAETGRPELWSEAVRIQRSALVFEHNAIDPQMKAVAKFNLAYILSMSGKDSEARPLAETAHNYFKSNKVSSYEQRSRKLLDSLLTQ